MRVPLRWLAEWIDLPETSVLAERLTSAGLAVDSIERVGPDLSAFRVGHVLERSVHPNADRLSLCRVDVGEGEPLEIVCGAPNVAAGQKVVVALPGTRLPDGKVLERAKIRGVASNGMICSARELGLGDDQGGILVLPAEAPLGAEASQVLNAGDTVLELELTPNRGDCASILGVAREVHALFGGALRWPPAAPREAAPAGAAAPLRIEIEDRSGCSRYVGRVLRGVRVGPSPDWLRQRLESAGMRAINNVVDVTNLVLLELGQPLHAFDLAKLRGAVVRVRAARAGETLRTLDGEERRLEPADLVIADAEGPIALAGVMGGADSEVGAATRDLLIESAHFDPSRVRRSARRLGLTSEASYRFERGIDRAGVRRAADRAAWLLEEIAGASAEPGAIEAERAPTAPPPEIRLDPARVNRLLGTALRSEEMAALLERVGIATAAEPGGVLRCRVPSHRNDIAAPVDLAEEVARIHGFDRIPASLPAAPLQSLQPPRARILMERARDSLVAAGLLESISLSFLGAAELEALRFAADDPRRSTLRLVNPVSEEEAYLRSSLVPSLLRSARQNLARRVERVRIFEVSRVFLARGAEELPDEPLRLAALLTRGERSVWWEPRESPAIFFEAKGVAERLLFDLGFEARTRAGSAEPFLHPAAANEIVVEGHVVGSVGELHPDTASHFEIDAACAVIELDLSKLATLAGRSPRYQEVSRQPPVRRDLALLLPRDVAAGEVLEAIPKGAGAQLVSVDLFDRWEGEGVPEGKVSLAFRLVLQRPDRAFTEAEITKLVDRVVQMIRHRFGGELR